MLRFLHVADLHLGMRITRFSADAIDKIREARFQALERVRDEARRADRGYQFVIVAGDLFDDVRVKRTIAKRAFDLLESFPVPVLVLSGNHDPLEPGSVWDSPPWNEGETKSVRVLRERQPWSGIPGVTLFPCPVVRKTSRDDPTRWIGDHPRSDDHGVRIGIAHGSVMDRPGLPEDDHPISPTAPADLDLDYLALGHWHRTKRYGGGRMVYAGVHEPMRFGREADSTGWKPYSAGGDREEFFDDGRGTAISVTIDAPGAGPVIEEIDVGCLKWVARTEAVYGNDDLAAVITTVAESPQVGSTVLRLKLEGTLPLPDMSRLDELREILGRYVVGEMDDSALTVEPTSDEVREAIGSGVLGTVFQRLQESLAAEDEHARAVANRALLLMYRFARQAGER